MSNDNILADTLRFATSALLSIVTCMVSLTDDTFIEWLIMLVFWYAIYHWAISKVMIGGGFSTSESGEEISAVTVNALIIQDSEYTIQAYLSISNISWLVCHSMSLRRLSQPVCGFAGVRFLLLPLLEMVLWLGLQRMSVNFTLAGLTRIFVTGSVLVKR